MDGNEYTQTLGTNTVQHVGDLLQDQGTGASSNAQAFIRDNMVRGAWWTEVSLSHRCEYLSLERYSADWIFFLLCTVIVHASESLVFVSVMD